MRKLHVLKINQNYYNAILSSNKTAELRKNDRDFKVGDLLHFTNINGDEYDGVFNLFVITHITPCSDVIENAYDYVMLSIAYYETRKANY